MHWMGSLVLSILLSCHREAQRIGRQLQRVDDTTVFDGASDSSESDDSGYHVVGRFGDTVFC